MILDERIQSRLIYCIILVSSLALLRCTSSKVKDAEMKEPVKVEASDAKASEDADLPPELRDADKFDPATTLDEKQVQDSDFYQVRKEVEGKKAHVDQEWKAQDQLEDSVRKTKEDEELKKKEDQKKEEESREKARLESVKNFNANAKKRAKDERIARDRVAKMPTITKEEMMWNGLE